MSRPPHLAPPRTASAKVRAATLAALLPLVGATALSSPAKAATVSCQAINATGIISGNVPSGACTNFVQPGDTFELDFTNVFTANGGTLPLDKFYSLQIANLNTGPTNTLQFSNVEFLVTGATTSESFSDRAITIWTDTSPTSPSSFAQGLSNYVASGNTAQFNFGSGNVTVRSQASFDLTGPLDPATPLGSAALINTIPVNLDASGITSFTGAKIRGVYSGIGVGAFSAGLASFTPVSGTGAFPGGEPDVIFGNAFNAVPGPLPIVGAGAAFGWSRRMRQRVREAKTSVATSLV